MNTAPGAALRSEFGEIDIYLFDQLLKGRFDTRRRVLDAGCGAGRNLPYFLARGFDIHAIDGDPRAVAETRALAADLAPDAPSDRVRQGALDALPWPDAAMDAVVCSAVLHFARDDAEFEDMLEGAWRVLASGGLFFCRLASSIGFEARVRRENGTDGASVWSGRGRYRLPDGTTRYLVDESYLVDRTRTLGGKLLDPLKTTVVQNQRSMTTWVVRKN